MGIPNSLKGNKIMRVVLFYPRGYDNSDGKVNISTLAASLPPLGLASIAAVLRKNDHEVILFDAAMEFTVTNDQWTKKILALKPDVVGFSAITYSFHDAYGICEKIKKSNDSIKTIFGGVHVSWGKTLILKHFPAIDVVIAGEGEYAFLNYIEGSKPDTIPGLFYRNENEFKHGPIQNKSNLCIMDDLPFPAYDLINGFPKKYAMALFSYPKHPNASIISSRGCAYQCSYCDRSVFQNSFRWNSPEYTFELIKWLHKDFGVRHVMFYDDLFTLNRKRVSNLCNLLRNSNLKITYNCIVRIGHIDHDLIKELKSSGCWMVHVGIESGDQDILDMHKEGLSLSDIRRDVEQLHNSGLWVKGLFMMGFPGEKENSIKKTITFASSLPLKDANLTAFTPYAGSPISSTISQLGDFDDCFDNWRNMDCVNFVFIPKEAESKEKLEMYYKEFLTHFYNRPFMRKVYRKMMLQSPHSFWRLIKNAGSFLGYAKNMKS